MSSKHLTPGQQPASKAEIDAFLTQLDASPRPGLKQGRQGRLIFAMDATASRAPTWDLAASIQGEMFQATQSLGGLSVQLVFYRGFRECHAARWQSDGRELARIMSRVTCLGGITQIARVLSHAQRQAAKQPVDALVFVGDAIEEEPDRLCELAGQLRLRKLPLFIFHEGSDNVAGSVFKQMAQLSGGAYARFDRASPELLKELLAAIAAYAAGGQQALEARPGAAAQLIAPQLKGGAR